MTYEQRFIIVLDSQLTDTGISAFYEIGSLGLAEQLLINLNVLWVLIVILPILWNGCNYSIYR